VEDWKLFDLGYTYQVQNVFDGEIKYFWEVLKGILIYGWNLGVGKSLSSRRLSYIFIISDKYSLIYLHQAVKSYQWESRV
jgi:hypothetical protein